MPIYECLTSSGTLSAHQRAILAERITSIHCEETGAPADFVHVIFPELSAGHSYTKAHTGRVSLIRGQVRAGRPPQVRKNLITRIFDAYVSLTGASKMEVVVAVLDVPASWAMEGGLILPEPNKEDEEEWFKTLDKSNG